MTPPTCSGAHADGHQYHHLTVSDHSTTNVPCPYCHHQSCSQWHDDDDNNDGPLRPSASSGACADGHHHRHTAGSVCILFFPTPIPSASCVAMCPGPLLSTNIRCLRVRVSPLRTSRTSSSRQYVSLQTLVSPDIHPDLPTFRAYHARSLSPPTYA